MDNADVARIFNEVADLLELGDENPFRIRAYRRAARTVETLGESVAELALRNPRALTELPGIAKDLAGKIVEIVTTGDLALRRELAANIPAELTQIMRLAGVGPKRAYQFYDQLGVKSIADLAQAAASGRLLEVKGVGEVLRARILKACVELGLQARRFPLVQADAYVAPLLDYLRRVPGISALEVAGSHRRRCETVGDIDVVAASLEGVAVGNRFVRYPDVREVLAHGETKSSVVLRSGLQVDLRVVRPEAFGAALYYFTGSKAHNITVRSLAVRQHLKINEYGVFRGKRMIAGATEEEVLRTVGLSWIPPELREDRGEIEAALAGELPRLVELREIRGDLQMHSTYSDGVDSLSEMVRACRARGYEYMAITDHTPAVRVVGGLDRRRFLEQFREIDELRHRFSDIAILKGAEVDILPDGRLDLDDETLAELDVVVASVHSRFNMPQATMTERVLRAMRNPRVHILAHPTGRLIGRREPYAIDMAQIVRAAIDLGVLLEINAQPERLDLNDVLIRMARDAGAKLIVDSDAHRTTDLGFMRYGVDQARRGWCAAADIANTLPLDGLQRLLQRRGRGPRRAPRRHAPEPRP